MRPDDCDRVAALSGALALGALDPDERVFVRAHLAGCGEVHPELRESMALAAAVGEGLPDADLPSAALRGRILEAARSIRSRDASIDDRPDRAYATRRAWAWIAGGAGALAVAASLALAIQVGHNGELREQVATLEDRVDAVTTELQDARAWVDRAVARGATAYFMNGEGMARQASFMLVVEEEAAGAVLLMSGLPSLGAGETYELWVERDGEVIGVGEFLPGAGGHAALTIDASLSGIRQAMITIEPLDGSDRPTDEVIMQGELTL